MNTIRNISVALALTVTASIASAQAGLTREQVKAELAEAQRSGDLVVHGATGLKANQLNPARYPATPAAPGKTRAQVKAELAEAQRTGDIVGNGPSGQKLNEMAPSRHATKPPAAAKTRAEVKAELAEAVRSGDMVTNSESGLKLYELSPGLYPMQARGRTTATQAAAAQHTASPAR
jgi:hypothetical protein